MKWLTAIKDGGTNTIVSYDYDAAGRRTNRTLANNTFTVYEYDNADQLTSIWHQRVSGATNTISRYHYYRAGLGSNLFIIHCIGFLVVRPAQRTFLSAAVMLWSFLKRKRESP